MKIFPKFGNGFAEFDLLNDIVEYINLKIIAAIIVILVWMAGFMIGAFAIYYMLTHGGEIFYFIGEALESLASS